MSCIDKPISKQNYCTKNLYKHLIFQFYSSQGGRFYIFPSWGEVRPRLGLEWFLFIGQFKLMLHLVCKINKKCTPNFQPVCKIKNLLKKINFVKKKFRFLLLFYTSISK